jgi:hypothetical protein
VKIELTVKPGVDGDLHFTIDGSEPGKDSPVYKKPFTIKKSSKVKAAIFITKGGQERKFVRNQQFTKITAANIE